MTGGEADVIKAIVKMAITDGCVITVDDGEKKPIEDSRDVDAIMGTLGQNEEEYVYLHNNIGRAYVGYLHLVYGNVDDEVVASSGWGAGQERRMTEILHAGDGLI